MEMEYFVPPERGRRVVPVLDRGRATSGTSTSASPSELLRLHEHAPADLSHYSRGTTDVEFAYPWGWDELEGIANRGDYDLTQHSNASGIKLEYFDQAANERYTPYVIEPAAGATRAMMAFLLAAYHEDEVEGETRTVLRLDWRLAPYQVAVLPLSKKPELEGVSREVLAQSPAVTSCATTTSPSPSGAATAARTRWARRTASRWTSTSLEDDGSPFATATPPTRTRVAHRRPARRPS